MTKNTKITTDELSLITGMFNQFRLLYKNIISSEDYKIYKSITTKLNDIQNNKIEWEEFEKMLYFLNEFKKQLIHSLNSEQMTFFECVINKLYDLRENTWKEPIQ